MEWGFFFFDGSKERLELFGKDMQKQGFTFMEIRNVEDDEGNPIDDQWILHLQKIGVYTPETIDRQNDFFYLMVLKYRIDTYDGYDVGPYDPGLK